jgi:ribonuclease HII
MLIIGVDEVARGCYVGPVVSCALILKPEVLDNWSTITRPIISDSKKMTPIARAVADKWLRETGTLGIGIGEASVDEIKELNIRNATFLAMNRALASLLSSDAYSKQSGNLSPVKVIVDGNAFKIMPGFEDKLSGLDIQTQVKADLYTPSVSCASIIAKEYRDTQLDKLADSLPEFAAYGWKTNRGYGTKDHQAAILREGITVHHRLDFLRNLIRGRPDSSSGDQD